MESSQPPFLFDQPCLVALIALSPDELRDFDVSADGQRILLMHLSGGGEGSARHLVLVQNWASQAEDGSKR